MGLVWAGSCCVLIPFYDILRIQSIQEIYITNSLLGSEFRIGSYTTVTLQGTKVSHYGSLHRWEPWNRDLNGDVNPQCQSLSVSFVGALLAP